MDDISLQRGFDFFQTDCETTTNNLDPLDLGFRLNVRAGELCSISSCLYSQNLPLHVPFKNPRISLVCLLGFSFLAEYELQFLSSQNQETTEISTQTFSFSAAVCLYLRFLQQFASHAAQELEYTQEKLCIYHSLYIFCIVFLSDQVLAALLALFTNFQLLCW